MSSGRRAAWAAGLVGQLALIVGTASAQEAADVVLRNGVVHTMVADAAAAEPPTALAVRGERIVAVGQDLSQWISESTRVVDLDGRVVLPGFIDAHGHLTLTAQTIAWINLAPPPVGPVDSIEALRAAIRTYLTERPPTANAWVLGFGYDDSLLAEQRHPTRNDLDDLLPNNPLLLIHVSGHLASLNSRGLDAVEISAQTPNPPGGVIRRRPGSTQPNGVVEETALFRIYPGLPQPSLEQNLALLDLALASYARHGITTVQDGATQPPGLALLTEAAERSRLNLDVIAYPSAALLRDQQLDAMTFREPRGRLKIGGVKLLLDGSPQGKTAFLTKPYHRPPPGQKPSYSGYPILTDEQAAQQVERFLSRGIQILAHANGDAAADQLLAAMDRALADGAETDHRTVVIHAQVTRPDQLARYAELGMIPSFFSAHSFFWGDWHRDSVLGYQRAERISPTRSASALSIPYTIHNDAPIVPPDMVRLLWATTNRRTRSGDILGPGERASVYEALQAVTVHAARQHFEEDEKGTLEVGKLADLVVLNTDPLALPPERLMEVEVSETYSRGSRVFPTP